MGDGCQWKQEDQLVEGVGEGDRENSGERQQEVSGICSVIWKSSAVITSLRI